MDHGTFYVDRSTIRGVCVSLHFTMHQRVDEIHEKVNGFPMFRTEGLIGNIWMGLASRTSLSFETPIVYRMCKLDITAIELVTPIILVNFEFKCVSPRKTPTVIGDAYHYTTNNP